MGAEANIAKNSPSENKLLVSAGAEAKFAKNSFSQNNLLVRLNLEGGPRVPVVDN